MIAKTNFLERCENAIRGITAGAVRPWLRITIGGHRIPWERVVSISEISVGRAYDFDDIPTGTASFVLDNFGDVYNPSNRNFFLGDSAYWYLKDVSIELSYALSTTTQTEYIKLFEGYIVNWTMTRTKGATGAPSSLQAEISCSSIMFLAGQKTVGRTFDDGTLNPMCYGKLVVPGVPITSPPPWPPFDSAGAESGSLSELSGIWTNLGTIAADNTHVFSGSYAYKVHCANPAYGALGYLNTASPFQSLISTKIYIENIPEPLDFGQPAILYMLKADMTGLAWAGVNAAGYFVIDVVGPPTPSSSSKSIFDYVGRWFTLALGFYQTDPGKISLFLDGEEIASYWCTMSAGTLCRAAFGIWGIETGPFTAWFDDIQLYTEWYPNGYYIPSYPVDSMDAAYGDGAIIQKKMPKYWFYRENRRWQFNNYVLRYNAGEVNTDLYISRADYAAIYFLDSSNPPSGSIFIGATKSSTVHPVDMLIAILTDIGLGGYIDTDSFALTKALCPNDIMGCYFTDVMASDAIERICEAAMYFIWDEAGKIKLEPYLAQAPTKPVVILHYPADIVSLTEEYDSNNVKNQITAKWAFYESNKNLFYKASDSEAITEFGIMGKEISYEYGSDVFSDNQTMVEDKADKELVRVRRPKHIVTVTLPLWATRIELGDQVKIIADDFWDVPFVGVVYDKSISFEEKIVSLQIFRFPGEINA
jgi:hypothetical protein